MSDREGESPAGRTMLVVLLFALLLQGLLMIFLPTGCGHFGPPPPAPPLSSSLAPCPDPQPAPTDIDVCEGRTTPEGFQCVRCDVDRACLLGDAVVYCTPACSDGYCGFGGRR